MQLFADTSSGIKVFADTLRKDTSDKSDLQEITIQFALVTEPGGHDGGRQALSAVVRPTEAVHPLRSFTFGSTIDTAIKPLNVVTFETGWSILLRRIELLDEIVANNAKVFCAQCLKVIWSAYHTDSSVCVTSSVCYISRQQSLLLSIRAVARALIVSVQVLINQKSSDDRIIRLASMMGDALAFVDDAEFLKSVHRHTRTITLLFQQVTECGYFITEHVKNDFCPSPLVSQ